MREKRKIIDTSRSTRQAVSALTATSTRHTGEWLTDRNIMRVKDLRNQPSLAATRHAHTVSTCPQASYGGAIVQEPETYAGSETLSQHDIAKVAGNVFNQTKQPLVRNNRSR